MKLCDLCKNNRHRLTPNTCACTKLGEILMRPMPEEGETAKQVCGPYESKEEEEEEC
jgi:hypothetical protein